MRPSLRSTLRRACGLLLAIGLLPAASGGAVCFEHWGSVDAMPAHADAHVHGAHEASAAHAAHANHARDAQAHLAHGHDVDTPANDAAAESPAERDTDALPPAHEGTAPCTALAACGTAAAIEQPRAIPAPRPPHAVVRIAAHALPRGPVHAPDVPPPRR